MPSRRAFLGSLAAVPAVAQDRLPPIRPITRGPRYHWFGYYDKLQFDPTSRYALGCEGTFQHRLNEAGDTLKVGMVDLQDNDRWTELGDTRSWSWHQTCMLQWLPGSRDEVLWNDRQDGQFVAHILNVRTGKRRTIPSAVYALSPDAGWAVVADFARSRYMRPETGYAGVPDPNRDVPAPDSTGLWRVDLATGRRTLLVSIADTVRVPLTIGGSWDGAHHYFDHLLVSPDGRRIVFLQRWGKVGVRGFQTRMFTVSSDGKDLFLLDPHGKTSHFIWRDPQHLLTWAWQPSHGNCFYLFKDRTAEAAPVAPDVLTDNGHCTYIRDGRCILTDTAPDRERMQKPALFDTRTSRLHRLARLYAPPEYTGVWRCDTTPRGSPDGRKVIVDSPHGGDGRQMYLIDVSGVGH